jgi:D-xylose transport system substrate-binding protein
MRLGAALVVVGLVAAGCGDDDDDDDASTDTGTDATAAPGDTGAPDTGGGGGGDLQIALLLPESATARYESQDRPIFEETVAATCPECEVLYSNANQDAAQQQSQAEAALTQGADVLVLDPVDGTAASVIVDQANAAGVPVISYDRLIQDAQVDYYISFDNEQVGVLQAESLLAQMEADGNGDGTIVMINGAPTDNNASLFKAGAHSVFDESTVTIGAEYDTPDWSPDQAQQEMEQAITSLGPDGIQGVYAANDGTAGGAIAAMLAAGIDPLPPVTGQDAELAGIQRILAGEQFMTVYKALRPEAEAAANLAVALARGEEPPADLINSTENNGAVDVPSIIFDPIAVTIDNVADTVVADGYWTVEEICTEDFADACAEAGIS